MKLLYFAWVRERIGKPEEEIDPPPGVRTVSDLMTWLAKWKTFLQLLAVGFLIAGEAGDLILPITSLIGIALLWLSALLTLYTGWDYFRAGVRHLIDE